MPAKDQGSDLSDAASLRLLCGGSLRVVVEIGWAGGATNTPTRDRTNAVS
jgi:hypothetical protein